MPEPIRQEIAVEWCAECDDFPSGLCFIDHGLRIVSRQAPVYIGSDAALVMALGEAAMAYTAEAMLPDSRNESHLRSLEARYYDCVEARLASQPQTSDSAVIRAGIVALRAHRDGGGKDG